MNPYRLFIWINNLSIRWFPHDRFGCQSIFTFWINGQLFMGYFLGKGTFIKSNYGFSSNVSVFCRCYGYSIVTVLDALDHDPYCGFATNGFQPMLRWFRFVGFLPLLTVTCRCTGFSLATGICRFLRILVALLRVLLRQSGWLHYYGHLPLQWSFLAANSLPCFRIFQSKASAVVTEFPTSRGSVAANDSVFFGLSVAVRVTADTFMGFLSHSNCDWILMTRFNGFVHWCSIEHLSWR